MCKRKVEIRMGPERKKDRNPPSAWLEDSYTIGNYRFKRLDLLLLTIFITAILLRLINNSPSFFSYWFDESEYSVRARYVLDHGGGYDPYFLRDHPPLFPYLLAVPYSVLGSEWYVGRGLIVVLSMINLSVFYFIGKEMKDQKLGLWLAALYGLSPVIVYLNREVTLDTLAVLFLSLSFLFVLKYLKDPKWQNFLAVAFFFGLGCLTKEVAVIFVLPLLGLVLRQKIYRRPHFYVGLLIFLVMTVPVYYLMSVNGFLSFHTFQMVKTSRYTVGNQTLTTLNGTSVLTFAGWVNIGFVPLLLHVRDVFRKGHRQGQERKKTSKGLRGFIHGIKDEQFFLILWLVGGLIFSLSITLMAPQYDFYPFIPIALILGLVLRRPSKATWLKVVLVVYLLISICGIGYFYQLKGADMAVNYMKDHVSKNDTMIVSDYSIFEYYFPDNQVTKTSQDKLATMNVTYVVMTTELMNEYLQNGTLKKKMSEYTLVYRTDVVSWDVEFSVYKRI